MKKLNVLVSHTPVKAKVAANGPPTKVDVIEFQRQVVSLLDEVEGGKRRSEEGASARIGRLMDAEIIPTNIGICMRTINSFRNTVVHDRYRLQQRDTSLILSAWDIIRGWRKARR